MENEALALQVEEGANFEIETKRSYQYIGLRCCYSEKSDDDYWRGYVEINADDFRSFTSPDLTCEKAIGIGVYLRIGCNPRRTFGSPCRR